MKLDFRKIEKKWQEKWEKAKIFEGNPNPKKKKYFLTVPYPYASGPMHVGHGRSYVLSDITVRFLRMQGINVLWPMAWHITGTPVLAISKRIKNNDKKLIEEHLDYVKLHTPKEAEKIVKTFTEPQNVANYYASVWSKDLKEAGCSIDWRRQFTTGESIYNQFIRWQYHYLNSLGYLIKGEHPVFYCPTDENPVTTDDVKSGDELEMTIGEFYLLKKPFEDGYLVSATLRIETTFGITNVWINPEADYVKTNVNGEYWYLSKSAANKLKDQNFDVKIEKNFKGKDLIGKWAKVPLVDRKVIILPANYVDPEIGSGVVISVPSHAPYDWIALEDIKKNKELLRKYRLNEEVVMEIKPISLIKVSGYSDHPASDIIKKLGIKSQDEIEKLEKATQDVYNLEFYNGMTTEICGEFKGLKVAEAKEKVFKKLLQMKLATKIYENMTKDKKGNFVKDIFCRDGTKIIVKVLKDQWFLDYANEKWKEKTRKLLSKIRIEPEIYRKQFEDSISWLHEWACARTRGLGTRLPYDERWIIESLSDSTIYMAFYTIVNHIKKAKIKYEWLTKEFFDYVFIGKGDVKKIKINPKLLKDMREEFLYWYPLDERRTATMHIPNHLSFFLFHHAAIFPENLWPKKVSINEPVIVEGKKMSKSLGNVIPMTAAIRKHGADAVRLYLAYVVDVGSTLDWRESEVEIVKKKFNRFAEICGDAKRKKKKVKSKIGKWLISKFYSNLSDAKEKLSQNQFKQYIQKIFFEILNEIEYYNNRKPKDENSVGEIFEDWIVALSPVIPHIAEEFWHSVGNKTFVSIEKWPQVKKDKVDKQILELEEIFRKTIDDLNHVLKLAAKKKKAFLYFVTDKEIEYFEEGLDYIKTQFKFGDVKIYKVSDKKKYDPQNKAAKAKYGKPGIYLE